MTNQQLTFFYYVTSLPYWISLNASWAVSYISLLMTIYHLSFLHRLL